MTVLDGALDRARRSIGLVGNTVRSRVFGSNNERLDFVMDSFHKLSPEHRTMVLAGGVGVIALFILAAIALYVSQVNSLSRELDDSFTALHELQAMKAEYQIEDKRYSKLIATVDRKTKNFKVKPFFEKVAKDLGVTMEGLNEEKVNLPTDNVLSEKVKEIKVTMRFPEISVPRLLNFLIEVEKSDKLFRVWDLQIRSRYGTKLYFSSEAEVRTYTTGS